MREGDRDDRHPEADDDHREDPRHAPVDLVGRRRAHDAATASWPARAGFGLLARIRRDDHPAGALGEHGLQGLAVERRAVAVAQGHHDRGGVDRLRLVDDRLPGGPRAHVLDPAADALAADQLRPLDLGFGGALRSSSSASRGRFEGTSTSARTWIARRRRAARASRGGDGLLRERVVLVEGDQHASVLDLLDPERGQRLDLDRLAQRQALVAPIGDVEERARRSSSRRRWRARPGRGPSRRRRRRSVPSPPKTAVIGTSTPRIRTLPGGCHGGSPSGPRGRPASGRSFRSRITETWATVNDSVAPKA